MAWRAAQSLVTLHAQLKRGSRAAPPATKADEWGLIGDAQHDPTSDHAPHNFGGWGSQIVTAADFPNRPDLGLDAHQVLDDIRRSRDPRVKYGISNGQMFSSYVSSTGVPAWTWRPYNPKNGDRHFTHGHLSVVGDARADSTAPWHTIGAPTPASQEVDMQLTDGFSIPNWDGDPRLKSSEPTTVQIALSVAQQRSYQAKANTDLILAQLKANAAADEVRDKAALAAIQGIAAATGADPTPILNAVKAVGDDAARQFTDLHARIAELEAELEQARAAQHARAQAEADATADHA